MTRILENLDLVVGLTAAAVIGGWMAVQLGSFVRYAWRAHRATKEHQRGEPLIRDSWEQAEDRRFHG